MPAMQVSTVAGYLATNFPEKANTPRAVVIPGPVDVNISEWLLPTLGQRPGAVRPGDWGGPGMALSRLAAVAAVRYCLSG
jgi:hypothetical protein